MMQLVFFLEEPSAKEMLEKLTQHKYQKVIGSREKLAHFYPLKETILTVSEFC